MEQKIAIVYASVDGQTKKICEKLNTLFKAHKIKTKLCPIAMFKEDLSEFNLIIIGASIRYGKHHKNVTEFIQNNSKSLNKTTTAFFSVNLVARKENKNSIDTNPYLIKFLKTTHWKPDFLEVFAGKLDYKSYTFLDRLMIKLIMKLTDGPTKSDVPIEYTDWEKVTNFGLKLSTHLKTSE
ncbi:menaquinone-dependent protoporphyrinogen IX dehydrogenase [Winogradskyella vidalii]|uniref:menaquinone-dependent protoporphyrinogen IX dehydrogenase n=1 Tax=Winogradskyella vidalii TaxID=2615024 RepID=UPI0015C7D473|nr:menaquinone-dependent protoporphyrinogen IX dehydrogenase [Winogradskyella vidalii]